jgi:hypothetical protein
MEPFIEQALKARPIQDLKSEFFIGEHGKGGPFGAGDQFAGFFDREIRVLRQDGRDHRHHDLKAAELAAFFLQFGWGLKNAIGTGFKIHEVLCYRETQI